MTYLHLMFPSFCCTLNSLLVLLVSIFQQEQARADTVCNVGSGRRFAVCGSDDVVRRSETRADGGWE